MTKRIHGKYPKGTRMRSLELSTGGSYPEPRSKDWQRFCRCGPRQTPARVYRGTPVCARCQSFIWLHGAPEWN